MTALRWIMLDYETRSTCDLAKAGAWRYSEDLSTEVLCLVYGDDGSRHRWYPGQAIAHLKSLAEDENITFVAHAAGFEKAIWRNIMAPVYGLPDIPNSRWHDTQAVCAMRAVPLKLEHAAVVLRLPQQKDMEGSALVRSLSKYDKKTGMLPAITPEIMERCAVYCEQDFSTQVALHRRLGWLPPGERSVWLLDQRINERGLRLDMEFVKQAQAVVDGAIPPLLAEFQKLTGLKSVGQRDKLIKWCASKGVDVPNMQKDTLIRLLGSETDEEEDDADDEISEGDTEPLPTDVARALTIRQLIGSASIKKLRSMDTCVGHDGRARGLLQYHGAGPGRWAGRLLQPHNFPRGTLKVITGHDEDGKLIKKAFAPDTLVDAIMTGDFEWVQAIVGPPVEAVVSSLRHAIIAGEGRRLAAGDFAGIEARIVLALAGQHDKTALMASGVDVYCDLAKDIFNRPIDKDADPEERQLGKEGVLGCGFQMGARKFMLRLAQKNIPITMEQAEDVVNGYRNTWAPKVPRVWSGRYIDGQWSGDGLENAALKAVRDGGAHGAYGVTYQKEDSWLTARLPSGRKLWYFNPQLIRKAMPWDETDIRLAWTYQVRKMGVWKTMDAYGGLLTENVVQALARDIMVSAMFKCEKNGFPVVLTVHDEIVCEPLAADADPVALKQIMTDVPEWARQMQIPIAAETWVGDRYRK